MFGDNFNVLNGYLWVATPREQIDLREVRAYGDSIHDLPMLRTVGRPCAVHPGRALRRVADDEGFRLLS